jgi:hypothetical protein
MSILNTIEAGIDSTIAWGESLLNLGTEGLDLWIGFLLANPQFALIGGWIFFLWWQLRWERAFPKKRDRELGFLELLSQTGIFLLGCIIWPFLALGKLGPQEAIFKIFSWKPTRFILKTLSLGA